ncbi:MAG: hypothetical protein P1P82_15105 [Bacteroidales bacterium]|nr:hypothetical protein [Bacteroidales bacterium]MDT8430682.1 hypothetical protein [Bacteroidales bacterium]
MRDKAITIVAISQVAKALGNLKDQMVFVGGAVAALYADSTPDLELRETYDIDLTSIEPVTWQLNLKPLMTGEKIIEPVMTLKISYLSSIIEIHW